MDECWYNKKPQEPATTGYWGLQKTALRMAYSGAPAMIHSTTVASSSSEMPGLGGMEQGPRPELPLRMCAAMNRRRRHRRISRRLHGRRAQPACFRLRDRPGRRFVEIC